MNSRWKTNSHSVYNLGYHIIWTTKYRRNVLTDDVAIVLKRMLLEKSKELSLSLEIMEVMTDHVHVFVKSEPIHSPHYIVQQFKGYTSKKIRDAFPHIQSRLPSLWTRSYYCESVGNMSEDVIKKYIENQKNV